MWRSRQQAACRRKLQQRPRRGAPFGRRALVWIQAAGPPWRASTSLGTRSSTNGSALGCWFEAGEGGGGGQAVGLGLGEWGGEAGAGAAGAAQRGKEAGGHQKEGQNNKAAPG